MSGLGRVVKLSIEARSAQEQAGAITSKRDQAIRDAAAAGATLRAIAEAAGVSFGRVHQIVQKRS